VHTIGNRWLGRPEPVEAAPYYFGYIDRVAGEDVVSELEAQLEPTLAFLQRATEARSLHRYAPEKWSMRQVLSHINDTERVFGFRALWFARGFESRLPSFNEVTCANAAKADLIPWARHVEEFRVVRLATLAFYRGLPTEGWMRSGIASGNAFTVRALAFITAGHLAHHMAVLEDRYLGDS
jgi:hypothetical protein